MTSRRLQLTLSSILALACCSGVAVAGRGGFGGGGFRGGGFGGYRGGFGGAGGYRGGGFGGAGGYRGGAAGYRGGAAGGAAGYRGGFEGARGGYGMSSFNRTPSFGMSHSYGGYGGLRGAGGLNPYAGGAAGVGRGGVAVAGERGGFAAGTGGAAGVRSYGAAGARGWHNPAYAGYHSGWVHGYWGGHYGGWGWGWGGYGAGLATGLAAWGLGSALYSGGWGYMPYSNPYYAAPTAVAAAGYDYAQPIDTAAAPPDAAVADPAVAAFDQARDAFRAGDYDKALSLTDRSLKAMPDDSTIHEFRAVTLFALGRYDDAAAALYGVLSVGPGWDWTTLIGLYADAGTFTAQQRALEQFAGDHPDSAAARFVLGYLYLTEGENDAAAEQLKAVTALQPKDRVSAQLLRSIATTRSAEEDSGAAPGPPVATAPGPSGPAKEGELAGTWTASPGKDSTIRLTVAPDGGFTWKVSADGRSHELAGKSTYGSRVLTLVQDGEKPPLVGEVRWQGDDSFTFQALGGGPGDPGLSFRRSS